MDKLIVPDVMIQIVGSQISLIITTLLFRWKVSMQKLTVAYVIQLTWKTEKLSFNIESKNSNV